MKKIVLPLIMAGIIVSGFTYANENRHTLSERDSLPENSTQRSMAIEHPHHFTGRDHAVFDITLKSDNPAETIKRVTPLIPTDPAKHYQVTVTIKEIPEKPVSSKADGDKS